MRTFIKPLLATVVIASSFNVLAVQKDITVNATVDAQLDVTQADNTPLPNSIDMQYMPGRGLESYSINTKVWSNSDTNNVKVRIASEAKLSDADGMQNVPLTVKFGGKTLTTADTEFTVAELFPAGGESGSAVMPLIISQTTKGVLQTGQYSGVVSLLLTQSTKTEPSGD